MRPASASAGGKVILLGEHAVVHGQPALAAGIGRSVRVAVAPRAEAGLELRVAGGLGDPRLERVVAEACRAAGLAADHGIAVDVAGDLPVAVGLGSSAALSVALVRALAAATGRDLADDAVARQAHRLESVFHGTPSGVDGATATYGGLLWFEAGPPPRQERVRSARGLRLVIVLTGSRHDTGRTVGSLRQRATAAPDVYQPVFRAIGDLVRAGRRAIESGDARLLGELMTMDHGLLRACGVSTPELDAAVDAARDAGALGAKMTGGGGGGAAIALAEESAEDLARALRDRGYEVMTSRVDSI